MALRTVDRMARMKDVAATSAYVLEHNRRRLLILLIIAAIAVVMFGARGVIEGIIGLIGQMPSMLVYLLFISFAMIAQFGVLMWFLSRPRKYVVTPDNPQIGLSFDSYRGQPDLLEHAKTTVKILRGVRRFRELGGELPKGMLLSGAPGTGKTFLAGVMAAEANLPFIYIDASSLTSMWMGMDALIVVRLFGQARKLARKYATPGEPGACIIFMDELDSIGISRGGMQGGQMQGGMGPMGMMGMRGFALNTLLNQMDSLGQHVEDRWKHRFARWLGLVRGPVPPKPLVFVIGATNRPDVLDPALTRPGRLDRMLNVYPPDGPGRRDIIDLYLSQKAHDPEIDVEMMVSDSVGWTPIHIKTIINEALIIAHEDGREQLTYKDWLAAADQRTLGLKQPATMTADDKRAIAYHEAGHAVVLHYLRPDHRALKASIIRRGETLGVVQHSEREERHTTHAREIEVDIMISLGSRAVEEVFLGTKMTGAASDLQHATARALAYVGMHGMGPSLVTVNQTVGSSGYNPSTLEMADRLLDQLYDETKRLVKEKDYAVHALASALIQRGELIGQELEELFAYAEEANADKTRVFERKPVLIDKPSWRDRTREPLNPVPAIAAAEGPATDRE
ncbi:MAG TPA: AAA family ATPase [Candidatus Limnocylindria bacterium]|nr:AAA family ATPase [Candidatus Limnocylindria bacterium]